MKDNIRFHAILVLVFGLASVNVNAALIDRGGGLIYDSDLNITWLADANYAMTSGYDADGKMTWSQALTWASSLSYGSYSDWRLPNSTDWCSGYNCTGNEMGHLFYLELGGVATFDISTTHNSNYSLFLNVPDAADYWTGTESYIQGYHVVMGFDFDNGVQSWQGVPSAEGIYGEEYAWAVRDGDVAAVPVPGAVWLFGSGLAGLLGFMRHRKA